MMKEKRFNIVYNKEKRFNTVYNKEICFIIGGDDDYYSEREDYTISVSEEYTMKHVILQAIDVVVKILPNNEDHPYSQLYLMNEIITEWNDIGSWVYSEV